MKKQWLVLSTLLMTLGVVFLFNNCQPIGEANLVLGSGAPPFDDDDDDDNIPKLSTGEQYFVDNVKPVFETNCKSCHDLPKNGGDAPLSIFDYAAMRIMMADGTSGANNVLVKKMQADPGHDGGNLCPGGIAEQPCKSVADWRQFEIPETPSGFTGAVDLVSYRGTVYGWAEDPNDDTVNVEVLFYLDAPAESGGILAGSITADQAGSGLHSGHYFVFQLPAEFIDNGAHNLYAYINVAEVASKVIGTPKTYAAYKPSTAGMDFFTGTIAPQLNCVGCHGTFSHDDLFAHLLTPTPLGGGNKLNNKVIVKVSGNDHPVNRCPGGIDSGLCADLQSWWDLNFAP